MSDAAPPPPAARLVDRARALRDRIDWMMLFPVAAALAWGFGDSTMAMVLVVVLPAFLALQGRPASRTAPAPAETGGTVSAEVLRQRLDGILADCAARDRTTAVLRLRLRPAEGTDPWDREAEDAVLARIALRVISAMRGRDEVLRSGSDELTVLLCPTRRADLPILMNIADRIQVAAAEPISLDGDVLRGRSAIGICSVAMAPDRSGRAMLAAAGSALAIALRDRSDAIRFYNSDLRDEVEIDARLAEQIDAALDAGRIGAWFQPQIVAATGDVAGFEALARWTHPELGVLEPERFLPAVRASGRMTELGEAVLAAALDALASWDAAGLGVPGLCVNLSQEELSDPRLAERLAWLVDQRDVATRRISFELPPTVTERAGDETVQANIDALRQTGFRLDLDDFGTGPATVGHVARFGVHRIVLDRSLIAGIDEDPGRRRIIAAILSMARVLGIETLAEGVETEELSETLREMECSHFQGFAIARAMPLVDTLTWLRTHRARRGAALIQMRPQGTA
ncbi:GGDEF domain-containing phosphodiesterase [Jannaschia formosa]|uniref:GGDEF domain-containing phosphodiesterase n=1 Tax=Jannaschia formosa TaxID=2259592 RepID=UPI000E1C3948|nr:GGDEF domain-containing phosphodiesterase [Jannaschia formosa]TFL17377.1 GGDEF domain-containing protein [Jannaschia formosa]